MVCVVDGFDLSLIPNNILSLSLSLSLSVSPEITNEFNANEIVKMASTKATGIVNL
jgi:hypothetical protein